jgi:hypothetical protein
MIPLILRFAQRIPPVIPEILRYDAERQIALVLENGIWIDRITAGEREQGTRLTRVKAETTDDA